MCSSIMIGAKTRLNLWLKQPDMKTESYISSFTKVIPRLEDTAITGEHSFNKSSAVQVLFLQQTNHNVINLHCV